MNGESMDTQPTFDWAELGSTPPPGDFNTPMPRRRAAAAAAAAEGAEKDANCDPPSSTETPRPQQRWYGPRTCRICLEVEAPQFDAAGRARYESADAELGRLLSPCRCRGSQKYVHEGCLRAWRMADPRAQRNFWQCPTCSFTYRLGRLSCARWLGSASAELSLTLAILALSVFLLGFVADPILALWADPVGTLSDAVAASTTSSSRASPPPPIPRWDDGFDAGAAGPVSWSLHLLKGFVSLGLLGFAKALLAMTPWQWWNLRSSGILGTTAAVRRPAATGRGRLEDVSIVLVIIGATTFLVAVWRAVRAFSAWALKQASNRVMDVGRSDEPDEPDE